MKLKKNSKKGDGYIRKKRIWTQYERFIVEGLQKQIQIKYIIPFPRILGKRTSSASNHRSNHNLVVNQKVRLGYSESSRRNNNTNRLSEGK